MRWIGRTAADIGGELGFVDVWIDGRRVLKRPALVGVPLSSGDVLATMIFVLSKAANHVEYRFFVNADTRITLQRISLESI